MFGLFKNRSKPEAAPETIAKNATIEPVLMAGDIGGFLVHLNVDHHTAVTALDNQAAQSSFVAVIESRIAANDFEDERFAPAGIASPKRQVSASAKRAVVTEGKPFVSW
jgi:hypothetical protein